MRPRGPVWRRMSDDEGPGPWDTGPFVLVAALLVVWAAYVAGYMMVGRLP